MTHHQSWTSQHQQDVIRLRKHVKVPSLRMPSRQGIEGPYYGEGQVFGGQSIEEIVASHPLIRGVYHVEVSGDDGTGPLNYINGGDLIVVSKNNFTYTPHAVQQVTVDCLVVQQRLMFREGHKHVGSPRLGKDWVRSPASLIADNGRLALHWGLMTR